MSRWLEKFSIQCIKSGIVTQDQLPWFIYGIEKRISTTITSIPFLLLAMILTTPYSAISMFLAFSLLRRRASGYHAHSIKSCLFISISLEIAFCIFLYPLLHLHVILLLLGMCIPVIFRLAPYKHPNMQFSDAEVYACQTSSRAIVCMLAIGTIITYAAGLHEISKGLTLGTSMTTVLLCIAYILEWRNKNEQS